MPKLNRSVAIAAAVLSLSWSLALVPASGAPDVAPPLVAVPRADCGPGSSPETGLQGRVSLADITSGRAVEGYRCNTELVGKSTSPIPLGSFGGFKVLRYVDAAGHECAYYDLQLLVGTGLTDISKGLNAGVGVLDMSNPAKPVRTATLRSLAMLAPHESLVLNEKRGLLAAVMGLSPIVGPGIVDVYDISQDCRRPKLLSLPNLAGILGHESGMAPDGRTFYSGNPTGSLAAVDITNPRLPKTLWFGKYASHGVSISDDGNRAYVTSILPPGVRILDVSQVQARVAKPVVREVSFITWDVVTIPQIALPVTIAGRSYLVEVDEYGGIGKLSVLSPVPGAARIIDITDEAHPRVVSNIRLEVHQKENFAALNKDPGAGNPVGGYAGHYCNVPRRAEPGIVACSMLSSGLRIFDIRDPLHPREIAYFNQPASITPNLGPLGIPPSWAQSSPAFVPERCEVWYSDGRTGFYAVRLTNGVCPFPSGVAPAISAESSPPSTATAAKPAATVVLPEGSEVVAPGAPGSVGNQPASAASVQPHAGHASTAGSPSAAVPQVAALPAAATTPRPAGQDAWWPVLVLVAGGAFLLTLAYWVAAARRRTS